MIAEHEPRLHALTVVPQRARCGETVTLTFRLRNDGGGPTAATTVRFVLSTALEPCDPIERHLEPVAPGEDVHAIVRARIRNGLEDGTELHAQAMLHVDDRSLPSNVCRVLVRTDARLDGPEAGTRVERVDADTLCVAAWCVNEGDGTAHDASLTLPVPTGCERIDGAGAMIVTAARLAPAQRLDARMNVRVVAPAAAIAADGARVCWNGGAAIALLANASLALAPQLEPPSIEVAPGPARATVIVSVANAGWVDARAVDIAIALSEPLRHLGTSIAVDGVRIPLRPSRAGGTRFAAGARAARGLDVVLARIPARSCARVAFEVAAPTGRSGSCTVRVGDHETCAEITAPARVDVRLRLVDPPRWVEPGAALPLLVEVFNAGDAAQRVGMTCEGSLTAAQIVSEVVRPHCIAVVALCATVTATAEGERAAAELVACSDGGECARLAFELRVRDDARIVLDGEPEDAAEHIVYAVRNVGSTTARGLLLTTDRDVIALDKIAPGARATIALPIDTSGSIREARGSRIALAPPERPRAGACTAELHAPERVAGGSPFAVRLVIDARTQLDDVIVRVAMPTGCAYVPGSASIDGQRLAERSDGTPVVAALRLGGVDAGTQAVVAWSLIGLRVSGAGSSVISATIEADGTAVDIAPLAVAIEHRGLFAAWRTPQRYFIDASPIDEDSPIDDGPVLATPIIITTSSEPDEAPFVYLTLRDGSHDDARRLLARGDDDGLLLHLFAVRALFPDAALGGDETVRAALDAARTALRDVFDRLFVKIRIPGFPVAADDIEDPTLRRALQMLFDLLSTTRESPVAAPMQATVRIDAARARAASALLATADLGAPAVLQTMLALVPTEVHDDPALATALTTYVEAIADALEPYVDAPAGVFDAALTAGRYPALDAARRGLIAALDDSGARTPRW
jgi:hypothetical protein